MSGRSGDGTATGDPEPPRIVEQGQVSRGRTAAAIRRPERGIQGGDEPSAQQPPPCLVGKGQRRSTAAQGPTVERRPRSRPRLSWFLGGSADLRCPRHAPTATGCRKPMFKCKGRPLVIPRGFAAGSKLVDGGIPGPCDTLAGIDPVCRYRSRPYAAQWAAAVGVVVSRLGGPPRPTGPIAAVTPGAYGRADGFSVGSWPGLGEEREPLAAPDQGN